MDHNPTLAGEHHHIIVAMDYFTKWVEAMPTVKYGGETVAHFLFNQIIARFEILKDIFIDHVIHFHNMMMTELASKLGFNHDHSSSYYPQ